MQMPHVPRRVLLVSFALLLGSGTGATMVGQIREIRAAHAAALEARRDAAAARRLTAALSELVRSPEVEHSRWDPGYGPLPSSPVPTSDPD